MVLEYEKQGKIAKFTINRPHAMNSLGEGLGEQLLSSLQDFQKDPQLWVGILTATGDRAFCVGADLKNWAHVRIINHTSIRDNCKKASKIVRVKLEIKFTF